jgi:mannitol/fructose-specific phosphotransferase system IIA component (Ntr-type)
MIDTKERSVRLEDFLRKKDVHLSLSGATQSARSSSLGRLRVAFGRPQQGVAWGAADREPVRSVFLLVAPHVSPECLPVLARIAHLVNNPGFPRQLDELQSADEFFQLLANAGV